MRQRKRLDQVKQHDSVRKTEGEQAAGVSMRVHARNGLIQRNQALYGCLGAEKTKPGKGQQTKQTEWTEQEQERTEGTLNCTRMLLFYRSAASSSQARTRPNNSDSASARRPRQECHSRKAQSASKTAGERAENRIAEENKRRQSRREEKYKPEGESYKRCSKGRYQAR